MKTHIKRFIAFLLVITTLFTYYSTFVYADYKIYDNASVFIGYMSDNVPGLVVSTRDTLMNKTLKQADLLEISKSGEKTLVKSYVNSETGTPIEGTKFFNDFAFFPVDKSVFKEKTDYCMYIVEAEGSSDGSDFIYEYHFNYICLFTATPIFTTTKLTVEESREIDLREHILLASKTIYEENFEERLNTLHFTVQNKNGEWVKTDCKYKLEHQKAGDAFSIRMNDAKNTDKNFDTIVVNVVEKVPQNFLELLEVTFLEIGSGSSSFFNNMITSFGNTLYLFFLPLLLIIAVLLSLFGL